MTTTETKVISAIKNACNKTEAEIINAQSWSDLNFDSLQTVELIMQLEDTFNIVIEDDDAEKLQNYNTLITYLKGRNL